MEKIVVGIDGSEQSKDALRFAVEEAEVHGARVLAVHAWMVPIPPVEPELVAPPIDYPALVKELQEAAERLLDGVVDEVLGKGNVVRVDRVAVEGPAPSALLDAAADADLIVVGSRGHGGFAKLLLGSVSEQVARHAPCPALIYRNKGQRDG
jgi:nucleotide-binding universal stress UspA family protein